MSISALDALQRGLLNLRANPTLVVLQVLQGVVVAIFAIAGVVPLVLAVGVGLLRAFMEAGKGANPFDPGPVEEILALVEQAATQWPMLLAAGFAALAVWTVGFLVYCWALPMRTNSGHE